MAAKAALSGAKNSLAALGNRAENDEDIYEVGNPTNQKHFAGFFAIRHLCRCQSLDAWPQA
jgi:hypothetical protein